MRNLLEEFHCDHGLRAPTILGVREHVFTGRYMCICVCVYASLDVSLLNQCLTSLLTNAVFLLWHPSCRIKKLALLHLVSVFWQIL